ARRQRQSQHGADQRAPQTGRQGGAADEGEDPVAIGRRGSRLPEHRHSAAEENTGGIPEITAEDWQSKALCLFAVIQSFGGGGILGCGFFASRTPKTRLR